MRISYSKLAALVAVLVVAYMTAVAVKTVPSAVGDPVAGYRGTVVEQASHPLEDGSEALQRDPFAKPGDALNGADGNAAPGSAVEDLDLTGVVFSGRRRVAYIGGKRLREGDRVGAFIVKSIEFNRVAVYDGARTYDLWLNASSTQPAKPSGTGRASVLATRPTDVPEFPKVLAGPKTARPIIAAGG